MNSASDIQELFESNGGVFYHSANHLVEKLSHVKAFVFDWDGVFNEGWKGAGASSGFSEIDSMGTNMLRFSTWLSLGKQFPISAVLTGARNPAATEFSTREKFQSIYFKVIDKRKALNHFLERYSLKASEVAFFYDDILDVSVAEQCGVNIFISSPAKVMFSEFVKDGKADYKTAFSGGEHGVREACELLIALGNDYNEIINLRHRFDVDYQEYLNERNKGITSFYTLNNAGEITEHHVE